MLGLVGNFQFIKVSEFNPPSLTTILKYQEGNSFLIPSSKGLPISSSPSMIILQKKKKLICLISKHFRINNSLYLSSSHLLSYPISYGVELLSPTLQARGRFQSMNRGLIHFVLLLQLIIKVSMDGIKSKTHIKNRSKMCNCFYHQGSIFLLYK